MCANFRISGRVRTHHSAERDQKFRYTIPRLAFILIMILLLSPLRTAAKSKIDSLLCEVDYCIENRPQYLADKRRTIDNIRTKIASSRTDRECFGNTYRLFQEYRTFSMDTSLLIARECRQIASRINSDSIRWLARIMESEALKGMGLYEQSLEILKNLPPEAREMFKSRILNRYVSIYYSLFENTYPRNDAEQYRKCLIDYRDSLVSCFPRGSLDHQLNKVELLRLTGDTEGAIRELDVLEEEFSADDVDAGVLSYIKAQLFMAEGERDSAKVYLARSAALDIERCIRKYESLQELAKLLNEDGDYERAYKYIMCSVEDIQSSNARSRLFKITEYLPIISGAYAQSVAESARNKNIFVICVSMLTLALIVALFWIYKRKGTLDRERRSLAAKNLELTRLKEELANMNLRLEESSRIKEEYIGYLFSLCSEHIDMYQSERMALARKIKAGKLTDVDKMLNSQSDTEYLKSFFDKFDSIFLDIFPDFIEKLNGLLEPGYQLHPKDNELLSPELRIYALVRLGINDSTKIANFLHYSPQTVYNYRFKVRSHAIVPKTDFVSRIQTL